MARLDAPVSGPTHTFLIEPDFQTPSSLPQSPGDSRDERILFPNDDLHVFMPCSPYSEMLRKDRGKVSRWTTFLANIDNGGKLITSIDDLQEIVLSYNEEYRSVWNFLSLKLAVESTAQRKQYFFGTLLKGIIDLAKTLPNLVCRPVPLLRQRETRRITLSCEQAACLLANAFLCTFPPRADKSYNRINFAKLFEGKAEKADNCRFHKILCILNYFHRVIPGSAVRGTMTFSRRELLKEDIPDWFSSSKLLTQLVSTTVGTIEGDSDGMLQLDFANKYVGSSTIGSGCVQEEILFVLCPELLLSQLFCQQLLDRECVVITGCQRYNTSTGFGDGFKCTGHYDDSTPFDNWNRRMIKVLAIDALQFTDRDKLEQFRDSKVDRELNKAFAGFRFDSSDGDSQQQTVATGRWGCGAFQGDDHLKALIQMMAAAEAGRNVKFYTFGNAPLANALQHFHDFVVSNGLRVGDLRVLIRSFYGVVNTNPNRTLFDYIIQNGQPNVVYQPTPNYDPSTDRESDSGDEL